MTDSPTRGRGWATAGFLMGIAVSVGGNVAHTWHPDPDVLAQAGATADTWRPAIGAQVFAAVWPLALLVTVEVLARVQWPRTVGWSLARYGGASLVAGVAAVMSYAHLNGLLRAYGEDDVTARLGPLSIDGLMIVCGFALLACSRAGAAATATSSPGAPESAPAPDVHSAPVPVPEGAPAPGGAPAGVPDGVSVLDRDEEPQDAPAPAAPAAPGVPAGAPGGVPVEVLERAATVFADQLAAGRVPGQRAIKRTLQVGQARARQVQAYLGGLAGCTAH